MKKILRAERIVDALVKEGIIENEPFVIHIAIGTVLKELDKVPRTEKKSHTK